MAAAAALLAMLQTLPSLKKLQLSCNGMQPAHAAAAGAAVGALIAHAPALKELAVKFNELGDVGLSPIFDALPLARQLESLDCLGNGQSIAFARDRILPAARACASLRNLAAGAYPSMERAMRMLEKRRILDQRYR